VAGEIEFDWDAENTKHLAAHKVTPAEFEQAMHNDPVDLDCDTFANEERFRSVGITDNTRLLLMVWTVRNGKIRPITAFTAGATNKKDFLEKHR
jgi:uncharacterized DUF497 family protein